MSGPKRFVLRVLREPVGMGRGRYLLECGHEVARQIRPEAVRCSQCASATKKLARSGVHPKPDDVQ